MQVWTALQDVASYQSKWSVYTSLQETDVHDQQAVLF